jgi:hypothetical protein
MKKSCVLLSLLSMAPFPVTPQSKPPF